MGVRGIRYVVVKNPKGGRALKYHTVRNISGSQVARMWGERTRVSRMQRHRQKGGGNKHVVTYWCFLLGGKLSSTARQRLFLFHITFFFFSRC